MNRKDFLKRTLKTTLGTGFLVSTPVLGNVFGKENKDKTVNSVTASDTILGFNHLPNSSTQSSMANTVFHKANTRGMADHGWLKSPHSFSFASYYNPKRMNFGVLRVLNDDIIAGGSGFGTHPHDNMEIISIPIENGLRHKDSMGNTSFIGKNEIQVMSAGTGVQHSEVNDTQDTTKFLQIWVIPNKRNVEPRYDQITLNPADRKNKLQQILSPNADDAGVWIHQNAWFHLGSLQTGTKIDYDLKDATKNGVYVFVLKGTVNLKNNNETQESIQQLDTKDGFGIWDAKSFELEASQDAEVLLMEVPMS